MFEVFDHTADLGLRVRADCLNTLFADAARGLFSVMVGDLDQVRLVVERTVHQSGQAWEYMLFDWLAELLYLFDTEKLVLARFDVRVDNGGLSATCWGEPLDLQRHALEHEVKAVTYHGLRVESQDGQWLAEVIVDI